MQVLFEKKTEFPPHFIREIMKQLLQALNYIHSKKIIHRDLKPENIIININQGNFEGLKLIDFGLSFQIQGSYLLKEIVGTAIYFAPEILQKKPYSHVII